MNVMVPPWSKGKMDLSARPLFVCWEVTKACKLACRHCRAKAIRTPLPGELDHEAGMKLIDQIMEFGEPYPALLFTGGDPLMRSDLPELIAHARDLGIYTAVAASVTDLLDRSMIEQLKELGVGVVSISLDGSTPETHDGLRGVKGTWKRSIDVLDIAKEVGLKVQINTTVMKSNLHQLPDLFDIALRHNSAAWEVFFLVRTGRGAFLENPLPEEIEEVMQFLTVAARYGIPVRTSEGAHFRRIIKQESAGAHPTGTLYRTLVNRLEELDGKPRTESKTRTTATGDGKGVILVGYNGDINPSGFLPLSLGKFPEENMVDVYRKSPAIIDLRNPEKLKGKCGRCEYRQICGGSRSRAFAEFEDPLEEDPLCIYQPATS